MTKRILAMVLVLAMVLSLMPSVVLAEGTEVVKSPHAGQHTAAAHAADCGVTSGWNAWGDDQDEIGLPTEGNWYLTKDVHITGGTNTTGNLNLCLNGYVIYKTGTGRIYGTKNGAANTMTICDCTAYEENGVYYAGALTGGKMTSQDGGGAIFVRRQGVLEIYDGRFIGNTYQNDQVITGGGAIMLQGVSSGKFATVKIHGGEFADNKAFKADGVTGNSGGVIGSGNGAVIQISDGIFRNNVGGEGGVISLGSGDSLTITGGKFTDNLGYDGGVIYGSLSTVSISGATFTGNRGTNSGSVLHNNGEMTLTIGEGTVITNNVGTNQNAQEGYSAAVSMCGSKGKLTLSGKVIISGNTTGATGIASLNFNKEVSDTLYVNGLAAGSCVEFSTPKTVPAAAGDVIALNGTQSSWTNGWVAHMGTDGKLQYIGYENSAFQFADAHVHTLCSDAGCTEHNEKVIYQPWGDPAKGEDKKLPAEGNWYLIHDVQVSAEVQLSKAENLNLCLNGKTITGGTGSGLRAYSTTADVATTINISDCQAKTKNGEYEAGKITGFNNTHTNSGGGVIFIRKGSTLNLFDGIITNNISASGGGAFYVKSGTLNIWNGEISLNKALNGTTKKHGGALFLDNAVTTLHDGVITGNEADQGAGAYMANGSLTIKAGRIVNNSANWGGGIAFASASSNCTVDMQGGAITGNTAAQNGGGIQGAYSSSVIKLSGDVNITGNTLTSGVANNIRLGGSGKVTVNALGTNSMVGITANAGREFSANALTSDLSGHFISDDDTQVVFLNTNNKLQLKDKPAAPPAAEDHKHTLCHDTGCTEHTTDVVYQPWGDPAKGEDKKLPTEGNWYLIHDVQVSAEVQLSKAENLNLCLNGKTITGDTGKGLRAYSTTTDVATTINISDCQAKTKNGEYEAGKITGFVNTHTNSGGGAFFVRKGGTLNFFDGIIENCASATGGGAFFIKSATATFYDGQIRNNVAGYNGSWYNGGAIYLDSATMILHNTAFTGNQGNYSGAIHAGGTSVLDVRGGKVTGNTAQSGGGAINATSATVQVLISGEPEITGNTLANGAVNNVRLSSAGKLTVGQLGTNAQVGITATSGRALSNALSSDVSAQFPSDDTEYVTFLNGDSKLEIKSKFIHEHCVCGDTSCTDTTHQKVSYNAWYDTTRLPDTPGNYCLMDNVTVSAEKVLAAAGTLNLCLNGKTITGGTGKGLRAYSTTANTATVINISDCQAKVENDEYKAGKFTGFVNTHTNSGGGAFFIRKGSTLNIYDGIIEDCATASGGAAICLNGATANIYGGAIRNNKAYYQDSWYSGGGVFIYGGGMLNLFGGEISGNEAKFGAGVYAENGGVTMAGGKISGNMATDQGGGVYLKDSASLVMTGGKICDNEAQWGAGVCFADGKCTVDMQGGEISGNTAAQNGGGIQAAYRTATVKISGNAVIMDNELTDGTANNLRLGSSAVMTVGQLGANAKVGITASSGRALSNAVGSDVSVQFPSDDAAYNTFLNADNKLQLKSSHIHCECGKTDCTDPDHQQVEYQIWRDATKLPSTPGAYCLATHVTISAEVKIEGNLTLCLNGKTVTGKTGKGIRFISTAGENDEVLTIADCTAKTTDGIYTAGGFYNCINTHTGSGGGAIFIRKGGTLKFYDGIVSGNASATGGGAFYIKEATANFYGGLIEKNVAGYENTYYNGGAVYLDNAKVTVFGGEFSGNTAAYGGGFHVGGVSTLDIRGGKIINNIAKNNGAGIQAATTNADVKLSGEPVIMGNKQVSGKANNLRLAGTGIIDVENLGEKAQIGITANAFRAISTKTKDYTNNFVSDEATLAVIYQDDVLFMGASGDHKHCACVATSPIGCDHSKLHYAQWNDPNTLPTSGNYYLNVDVTISTQTRLENATLNLCLNGHTVKVAEQGGRVFYMTSGAKLNISDCTGKGKLTNATKGAILTNAEGKNMELNLYGGEISGNHALGSGGAIVVQGECTFNMYGGKISGNSATSYLKTDADGKVLLDSKGNQSYYSSNGGALYVANGVFNMYGGEISGNKATEIGYLKAGATAPTNVGGTGGAMQITVAATANLYGGKICGNTAFNGGGVFVTGTDTVLNLLGTEISGNTANNGGGVISQTHAVTNMKAGKISGNTATASGAGFYVSTGTTLYMSGGEICQNVAANGETAKNGGGLYVLSSTVEFTGGKVWGNKAASGAAMYSAAVTSGGKVRAATIYIKEGALITDNHASANGGAIMMSGLGEMTAGEGSKIVMTGGEVSKNTAKNAGAIITQTKAAVELSGGKITENKATDGGGGMYISTGTLLTMTGGEISKNTSKNDGGGLYMLRSTGVFKGGSISNNTGRNGGGIKNNGAKMDIYKLNIVGNKAVGATTVNATTGESKYTAGMAGGMNVGRAGYKKNGVQMYQTPVINIYGIYVANNQATGAAGGMLIQSKDTVFNMQAGTITGNVTESGGGAIYLSTDVKATITGGTLSNNKAKTAAAIHILNNNAKISGLKVYGNEATNAAGAFTITGKTTDATIKNCEIYNNTSGGHVGALASQGYANVTIEDSKIYGNTCVGTGGAVYFSNPGYGTLRNVEIYENQAGKQAGAIFLGVHSVAVLENVTIRDNVAAIDYGGAIYNRGRIELKNCKVLNNTVTNGAGGGIGTFKTSSLLLADDAGVYAENCIISGNKAGLQGGAIYGHRGCPVYLTDCVITDNTSAAEGGAVFSDGRLGMQNVTITGNTSGGEGFAVYLAPSEFDGHTYQAGHKRMGGEMIIKDNKGGDLYLAEGTALAVTGEGLGQKSQVNVTLFSGVVTQWVQGVYNYEGGDLKYVLTAGDRSVTDPEPIPATENAQNAQGEKVGDAWLYVIIGVFVAVVIAVAAVVVAKKKKKTPIAGNE